jgi:hypothetical protein
MGRNFYSRNSCYSNCFNPCVPFCGPICPPCGPFLPPCGPCLPLCPPCGPYYDDCCKSHDDNGKTYVIANSQDSVDLSGVVAPYTISFQEQQDCLCEFTGNTTFIPKCNGTYKFNVSATVTATSSGLGVYSIKIVANGTDKYTYSLTFTNAGTQTANFCANLSLCKGNIVIVTITPPTGNSTPFAPGTVLGSRVLTINKSKCCGGNSCCSKSSCSSCC